MSQDYQIVRFKKGKLNFEIMTKPGTVLKYRKQKETYANVVFGEEIFSNFSKAERANDRDLNSAFGTEDVVECIKIILEKGDLQLSAAERKAKVDKKRGEIINYICKYYVDPKTRRPHPVTRIENGLDQIKYNIDGDTPADRQVLEIMKKLVDVMPLRKEAEMTGKLTIPHQFLGQTGGLIAECLTVQSENYTGTGCEMKVSVSPGDYDRVMTELQRITKGSFSFDIDGAKEESNNNSNAKGKKKGKKGGRGRGRGKGK